MKLAMPPVMFRVPDNGRSACGVCNEHALNSRDPLEIREIRVCYQHESSKQCGVLQEPPRFGRYGRFARNFFIICRFCICLMGFGRCAAFLPW